jgi:hypothetical protein
MLWEMTIRCLIVLCPTVAEEEESKGCNNGSALHTLSPKDIGLVQDRNVLFRRVKELVRSGKMNARREPLTVRLWMKNNQKMYIENEVLYRLAQIDMGHRVQQICLPEFLRKTVYEELHIKMGHLGADRVWPRTTFIGDIL